MASIKLIQKYQDSDEDDSDSEDQVESSIDCRESCSPGLARSPKCFIEPYVEDEIPRTLCRSASKRGLTDLVLEDTLDIQG